MNFAGILREARVLGSPCEGEGVRRSARSDGADSLRGAGVLGSWGEGEGIRGDTGRSGADRPKLPSGVWSGNTGRNRPGAGGLGHQGRHRHD